MSVSGEASETTEAIKDVERRPERDGATRWLTLGWRNRTVSQEPHLVPAINFVDSKPCLDLSDSFPLARMSYL
jgi:hypothetical protein